MRIDCHDDLKADVSMSPLIDCVFLLLIFFLVASMFRKVDRDIDVSLPVSESAIKMRPASDNVVIGITVAGDVFFEGAPSSMNDVHEHLKHLAATDRERRVRLDADADAPIFKVVEVLDACQFRGLNNVSIRAYDESYNR